MTMPLRNRTMPEGEVRERKREGGGGEGEREGRKYDCLSRIRERFLTPPFLRADRELAPHRRVLAGGHQIVTGPDETRH